jgi:ABC-2 type transport system ATP-binding protein
MSEAIVSFEQVTKIYRHAGKKPRGIKNILASKPQIETVAVNNVSFSINRGDSIAFIGPNGSGKSTTIKILTGILHADAGKVSVLGLDPKKQRVALTQKIGCVFGQKSNLFYHIAARDTFDLLARIYDCDRDRARARAEDLIELFGAQEYVDMPVRKLSLGQRMKCEIIASLVHEPDIIFLDEPTIGLDVIAKQQIRDELIRLNKEDGITIFLTSHDAGDVDQIAERTMVINHGHLLFDGTTQELKDHYVHEERVEVVAEPSMEDIITEIYRDARDGIVVGNKDD